MYEADKETHTGVAHWYGFVRWYVQHMQNVPQLNGNGRSLQRHRNQVVAEDVRWTTTHWLTKCDTLFRLHLNWQNKWQVLTKSFGTIYLVFGGAEPGGMAALSAAGGADLNHIWYGRVSQRFRSEWQPVWINVTKNTLSSYKSEVGALFLNTTKPVVKIHGRQKSFGA